MLQNKNQIPIENDILKVLTSKHCPNAENFFISFANLTTHQPKYLEKLYDLNSF